MMIWMVAVLLLSAFAVSLWLVHRFWPVKGLAYVEASKLREARELPAKVKMVDVRDAFFYEQCHVSGAINISIGRLPFLWNKELSPDEPVVILSDSLHQGRKAARLLKSRGFQEIYAVRGKFCA